MNWEQVYQRVKGYLANGGIHYAIEESSAMRNMALDYHDDICLQDAAHPYLDRATSCECGFAFHNAVWDATIGVALVSSGGCAEDSIPDSMPEEGI